MHFRSGAPPIWPCKLQIAAQLAIEIARLRAESVSRLRLRLRLHESLCASSLIGDDDDAQLSKVDVGERYKWVACATCLCAATLIALAFVCRRLVHCGVCVCVGADLIIGSVFVHALIGGSSRGQQRDHASGADETSNSCFAQVGRRLAASQ